MGLGKFFARKGSIGQTAIWVSQAFWGAIGNQIIDTENFQKSDGLKQELKKIAEYALEVRFFNDPNHPHKQEIMYQYENNYGPGLAGLTVAILDVEAEFSLNTEQNQKMFWEIIYEELEKKKIGKKMIYGSD
mgnify:CR=1 FL=1